MEDAVQARTPVHLWVVAVLATLWNAIGAFDYLMTRMRNMDYLSSIPGVDANELLAWIDAFPIWAQFGWGLGVWAGFAGSLLLFLRSRYAMWAFGLSLLGIFLGIGYQLVFAPPLPGADQGMAALMPYVVIAVGVVLFIYARAMEQKGVLR
jgi:hypothetical protein